MKNLNDILLRYKSLCNSDVKQLRNLIPPTEVWRFFIDGNRQNEGWVNFENKEPGYLQAMTKAFQKIFLPSSDLESLAKELHLIASTGVNHTHYEVYRDQLSNEKPGEYRQFSRPSAGFHPITSTSKGVEELLQTILDTEDNEAFFMLYLFDDAAEGIALQYAARSDFIRTCYHKFYFGKPSDPTSIDLNNTETVHDLVKLYDSITFDNFKDLFSVFSSYYGRPQRSTSLVFYVNSDKPDGPHISSVISKKMQDILKQYHEEMNNAHTPYEKLIAIVRYIQGCERRHPFLDCNTRTYSMLLANHLLSMHGFPIAIHDNPNRCYAITLEEMAKELIEGMSRTLDLASGELALYGVKTHDLLAKATQNTQEVFKAMVAIEHSARPDITMGQLLIPSPVAATPPKATLPRVEDLRTVQERKAQRDKRILQRLMNNELNIFDVNRLADILEVLYFDESKLKFIELYDRYIPMMSLLSIKTMAIKLNPQAQMTLLNLYLTPQNMQKLTPGEIRSLDLILPHHHDFIASRFKSVPVPRPFFITEMSQASFSSKPQADLPAP